MISFSLTISSLKDICSLSSNTKLFNDSINNVLYEFATIGLFSINEFAFKENSLKLKYFNLSTNEINSFTVGKFI
jgi:hypothetical protein